LEILIGKSCIAAMIDCSSMPTSSWTAPSKFYLFGLSVDTFEILEKNNTFSISTLIKELLLLR
jgi:hypothetical protein